MLENKTFSQKKFINQSEQENYNPMISRRKKNIEEKTEARLLFLIISMFTCICMHRHSQKHIFFFLRLLSFEIAFAKNTQSKRKRGEGDIIDYI